MGGLSPKADAVVVDLLDANFDATHAGGFPCHRILGKPANSFGFEDFSKDFPACFGYGLTARQAALESQNADHAGHASSHMFLNVPPSSRQNHACGSFRGI